MAMDEATIAQLIDKALDAKLDALQKGGKPLSPLGATTSPKAASAAGSAGAVRTGADAAASSNTGTRSRRRRRKRKASNAETRSTGSGSGVAAFERDVAGMSTAGVGAGSLGAARAAPTSEGRTALEEAETERSLQRIAMQRAVSGQSAAAPPAPSPLKQHMSDFHTATEDSEGGEARLARFRPAIYPHAPETRKDSLEANRWAETELLDALKLESFEGFYNLSFVMLAFSLLYIAVRNVTSRGFELDFADFGCAPVLRDLRTAGLLNSVNVVLTFTIFAVQRAFVNGAVRLQTLATLYGAAQVLMLAVTVTALYLLTMTPVFAAGCLIVMMVLMLKSHSYIATNYALYLQRQREEAELGGEGDAEDGDDTDGGFSSTAGSSAKAVTNGGRKAAKAGKKLKRAGPAASRRGRVSKSSYPHNIRLGNFVYFMCAPTLVYEPRYPRSPRIRWLYVLKKLLELGAATAVQYFIVAQFLLPVLQGRNTSNYMVVDLMKLAMPSFLTWLVGFYALFHCGLNIAAELLRFGDREFFHDWWNATTIESFWRRWNQPVHEWCLRHIYVESMHYARASKKTAIFSTFLLSAVLHELLFSVAFKTFRPWFFLGMLFQIPMSVLSRSCRGRRRGNLLVWWSLFAGQPLLEMLYFREWYEEHDNFFCVDA